MMVMNALHFFKFRKWLIQFVFLTFNPEFWEKKNNNGRVGGFWFIKCLFYRDKLRSTLMGARGKYPTAKWEGRFNLEKEYYSDGREEGGDICEFECDLLSVWKCEPLLHKELLARFHFFKLYRRW